MSEYCNCSGRWCRTKEEKEAGKCDTCLKPYMTFAQSKEKMKSSAQTLSTITKKQRRPYTKSEKTGRPKKPVTYNPKKDKPCDHLFWAQVGAKMVAMWTYIKTDNTCSECGQFVVKSIRDLYVKHEINSYHEI